MFEFSAATSAFEPCAVCALASPHPHTSQGHRGYLADSICVLFVLLRIPTLPAPGLGS